MTRPPAWQEWLALGLVYVIWGSTYLAIRVVVGSLPPLGSAAVRFVIAALALALFIALRSGPGALRVTRAQLRSSAIVGLALLLGGNGLVQLGEREVPSALTALLIGATPLWIVLYRRIAGERIGRTALVGVLIGFVGVGFLALPRGISGEVAPLGLAFILLASMSWGFGTFISKRLEMPRDALASTTLQQLFGGIGLLVASLLTREAVDPAAWSVGSLSALAYLIAFGSLVAFSAYTWLLVHVPVTKVSTYAYVNPVVAVILGALILQEPITPTIVVGAVLVIAAVALIVRVQPPPAPDEAVEPLDARSAVRSAS